MGEGGFHSQYFCDIQAITRNILIFLESASTFAEFSRGSNTTTASSVLTTNPKSIPNFDCTERDTPFRIAQVKNDKNLCKKGQKYDNPRMHTAFNASLTTITLNI